MIKQSLKFILLVAGQGSRLRPYTNSIPKCLVEINNKSLLQRQLDVINSLSQKKSVTLVAGYKAEKLKDLGLDLIKNLDYETTNMVWSLFCAKEKLNHELVISYGDIVYSKSVLEKLLKSSADISIVIDKSWREYWSLRTDDPLEDAETLILDKDDNIIELGKAPKSYDQIQGQYIGLMKFSSDGIESLKEQFYKSLEIGSIQGRPPKECYMTDLIQEMIDNGFKVKSIPIYGEWLEVDTTNDLNLNITIDRAKFIADNLESSDY